MRARGETTASQPRRGRPRSRPIQDRSPLSRVTGLAPPVYRHVRPKEPDDECTPTLDSELSVKALKVRMDSVTGDA